MRMLFSLQDKDLRIFGQFNTHDLGHSRFDGLGGVRSRFRWGLQWDGRLATTLDEDRRNRGGANSRAGAFSGELS
jgi:hypothetical protein